MPAPKSTHPHACALQSNLPAVTLAIVLSTASPALHAAEEFAPFAFTGYEGYVSARHVSDEYTTRQAGPSAAPASRQRQSDERIEAFLMTHSYIYHPKFIALDVGGGPIFQSGQADNSAAATQSRRTLFNFSARATVLADKPYNGSLYYERLNPTLLLSPGEVFNQATDEYGLTFALLAPFTVVPLAIDASRSHTTGSSATRVIDDRVERRALRANLALWGVGGAQLGYHDNQHDSSSGSPNLAIQNSQLRSRSLNLDTQLQFGANRQHEFFNTVLFTKQDYALERGPSPRLGDSHFLLVYRSVLSKTLHSLANYRQSRSEQDDTQTDLRSANANLAWNPSNSLALTGGLHGEDTVAPQFTLRAWGIDASVRYERALASGSLRAGYSLRLDQRDQLAAAVQPKVVGERLLLSGTSPVVLARSNVTTGSLTVGSATRTQVFLEGIDYALTVVGATTRIERILSGNILDGETVVVDYAFDAGGTYASRLRDHNLNVEFAVSRNLNLYLRLAESVPLVVSGQPSTPLNTVRSALYGARGEVPLGPALDLNVGGYLEREDRRETIAPYVRTSGELHLQGSLPIEERINLRAAARQTRVKADNPLQDVALTGYELSLDWTHGYGLRINAEARFERDTAGLEIRDRKTATVRALWRYRQLTLSADLSRVRESQGAFVREQTAAQLILRREI